MANKLFNFRCPDYMRENIEVFAQKHDLDMSSACRNLIAIALDNIFVEECEENKTFLTSSELMGLLQEMGYERISDIPDKNLDDVVREYLANR